MPAEAAPAVFVVSAVVSMILGMALLVETVIGLGSMLSGLWQLLSDGGVRSAFLGLCRCR